MFDDNTQVIKWGDKYLAYDGKYSWVKNRASAFLYLGSNSVVSDFLSGQRNQDTIIAKFLDKKVITVLGVTILEHAETTAPTKVDC